ncbi:MAG: HigA family addiction module antitoxin [Verrucomicrobiota bacterium]|nr:HigA family addiction module antitoxin [Verrucomicrobiota bacterium]
MNKTSHPPAYATPPGDTLLETIQAMGMSQVELESRTGINKKTINRIIKGKEPITQKTALALEKVLKVPAHFWLNMDNRYRQNIARQAEAATMSTYTDWVKTFPYRYIEKLKFVPPASTVAEKAGCLLNFFGVSHPDGWRQTYVEGELALSYRKTPNAQEKLGALSAWLRQGEIQMNAIPCADFNESSFQAALKTIRGFTMKEPNVFVPKMKRLCADAGVIYQLVPELPGLGISGVMRWYRGKPVIQQSLLFKSNDHFWFTFFHEAKHVLQNRKKDIFLEGVNAETEDEQREEEANVFSRHCLIPEVDWSRFVSETAKMDSATIRAFAQSIQIHPGIVVGRVMREKLLPYSHPARHLITKFTWE